MLGHNSTITYKGKKFESQESDFRNMNTCSIGQSRARVFWYPFLYHAHKQCVGIGCISSVLYGITDL